MVATARAILNLLAEKNAFDLTLNVQPHLPLTDLPVDQSATNSKSSLAPAKITLPPLLKAYVNMGARVAPIPHWDTEFNVADLFILLDTKDLNPRYLKRFMKVAASVG